MLVQTTTAALAADRDEHDEALAARHRVRHRLLARRDLGRGAVLEARARPRSRARTRGGADAFSPNFWKICSFFLQKLFF